MEIDIKNIAGITVDSREVKPGFVFVAIKGALQDGHNYIETAIVNGAKTIIHQDEIDYKAGIKYIKVKDSRIALAELASIYYPKQPKYILGVTGTNGKSSIVHFIREILHHLDKKAVSIGTLGVLGDIEISSKLTTPSTIELHKILTQIFEANINYAAIECSSHGIDQHRLDQVRFTACGFSNFSQDHLDYHHTMENYLATKERLFSILKNGYAILNTDIPEYNRLYQYCKQHQQRIITYGKKAEDIIIKSIKTDGTFQEISWEIFGALYHNRVKLVGEFQVYNLACAIGLLFSTGIPIKDIIKTIANINGVTGRMELITTHNNANIFVDYAHTPDALEHALSTLKQVTKNKLYVVFGCGGNRDKEKRPMMGKVATIYSDEIIITDDNPRGENPAEIRKDILKQCKGAIEIAHRDKAIEFAISQLKPGDNLLIAGKGHENYQIIGDKTIKFSDKEKVLELCR